MYKFNVSLLLIISLTLCGCATIYNPATEKKEFVFVTTPIEVSIGNMLASKFSQQFQISKDKQKTNIVTEIGQKIARVSDRTDLKYYFNVVEDASLNAFTAPGGYIYINSGLIEKATQDELACVIGHEVGHVAARHIAKKLQTELGYDILMNIATRKAGFRDMQKAVSLSYNLVMLGYSREDELLSDRLGAKYAYKAGYDPYAMVSFLKKLKDANPEEIGFVFLRSHPYASQRINLLEKQIPAIIEKIDKKATLNALPGNIQLTQVKQQELNSNTSTPLRVMCPVCKRIFSGKTKFCPYDGTKL